jgi:hypothetical protein
LNLEKLKDNVSLNSRQRQDGDRERSFDVIYQGPRQSILSRLSWHRFLRQFSSIGKTKTAAVASEIPNSPSFGQVPPKTPSSPALPYAPLSWQCKDDSSGDNQNLNLILLSANHRTGSTLLQRICNARRGTLIWGEHGGLLRHFANIYRDAAHFSLASHQERETYFNQGENPNLWIANMCPELEFLQRAVVDSARALMHSFYGQYRGCHDILGFKEVQYNRAEMELLYKCYPKAHFLLLVRNPVDTWKSTPLGWYSSLDSWMAKWINNVRSFQEFDQKDGNFHLLRYEDLIRQEKNTLTVLGEVAKVTREHISMVLAYKIGHSAKNISDSDRETIIERCREPMKSLGYI